MRLLFAPVMALLASVAAQDTGLLRIEVALNDPSGSAIPVPRARLLISDNPATREPRRVRTGADGAVEIRLPAGNYTVESEVPVSFAGRSLTWTQTLDVPAGRDTVLTLTAANAAAEADTGSGPDAVAATHADGAAILHKWQGSLAEIWSPTRHATGFIVDARGLIATNDHAIGEASDVEVEFAGPGTDRAKVPGRVIASDRTQGVTLIRVDPAAIRSRPPIAPQCAAGAAVVAHDQKVVALIAPMLEPRQALNGSVTRADSQSFRVDWRLEPGTAGGPVFAADGTAIGIAVGDDEHERGHRRESYVIPLHNACPVIAGAETAMADSRPPAATLLRTEAGLPRARIAAVSDPKAPRLQPPVISSDDFDIALVTTPMVGSDASTRSPRTFFGYWSGYVANAPQALFVRVSPQFEESFWKMLARGAAATQGVALPPLKSFSARFLRMRAFCGATEVTPIHRMVIEMPVQGRESVREGLYVFALTDFGTHCASVRFDLFSEKSPNKADSRTISPEIFDKIAAASQ